MCVYIHTQCSLHIYYRTHCSLYINTVGQTAVCSATTVNEYSMKRWEGWRNQAVMFKVERGEVEKGWWWQEEGCGWWGNMLMLSRAARVLCSRLELSDAGCPSEYVLVSEGDHVAMNGLCCHLRPCGVHGSYCHQGPWGYLWSVLWQDLVLIPI